jgi:hypothetical protein
MPPDIERYLRFLRSVEYDRLEYEGQLMNALLPLMTGMMMPDFSENSTQPHTRELVARYLQMVQQYAQATRRFQVRARQVGVPASCQRLHADYTFALMRSPDLILETARRLNNGDYGGLQQMLGRVRREVDVPFADADRELEGICRQYDIRKPFDIGNGGGGSPF